MGQFLFRARSSATPALAGGEGAATSQENGVTKGAKHDATKAAAGARPLPGVFGTETVAELCVKQGRVDEAVAIFRRLLERKPDDARASRWQERIEALETSLRGEGGEASGPRSDGAAGQARRGEGEEGAGEAPLPARPSVSPDLLARFAALSAPRKSVAPASEPRADEARVAGPSVAGPSVAAPGPDAPEPEERAPSAFPSFEAAAAYASTPAVLGEREPQAPNAAEEAEAQNAPASSQASVPASPLISPPASPSISPPASPSISPPASPSISPAWLPALVIREPVRSGSVIYAEGRDLVVMAPVSSGAELIADGHIHVYGTLRGRAVAGARGDASAFIFCTRLEAELVGIDDAYLTAEELPPTLVGKPVKAQITEGVVRILPL